MASNVNSHRGGHLSQKIRLTVICGRNLAKKDFFRLPDPFAKISVDGSGQCYSTEVIKNTLDPKWNQHYDLFIGHKDGITISIWNNKKIHKKQGAGFLGLIRIYSNTIQRLKDTGFQKLDLQKNTVEDNESVKGQIVISLISRDRSGPGCTQDVEGIKNFLSSDPNELPDGWEERRSANGRVHYINHVTRSTQFERPTLPAAESVSTNGSSSLVSPRESPTSTPSTSATELPSRPSHHHSRSQPLPPPPPIPPPFQSNDSSDPPPLPPARNLTKNNSEPNLVDRTSQRRRSTRHKNYLSRSQLHQAVDLPEGYEQRTTSQGQVYYLHTATGVSTWHDPRVPRNLNNTAVQHSVPLMPGWEMRRTANNRVYYVDHNNRTTQFTDPRLTSNSENLHSKITAGPAKLSGASSNSTHSSVNSSSPINVNNSPIVTNTSSHSSTALNTVTNTTSASLITTPPPRVIQGSTSNEPSVPLRSLTQSNLQSGSNSSPPTVSSNSSRFHGFVSTTSSTSTPPNINSSSPNIPLSVARHQNKEPRVVPHSSISSNGKALPTTNQILSSNNPVLRSSVANQTTNTSTSTPVTFSASGSNKSVPPRQAIGGVPSNLSRPLPPVPSQLPTTPNGVRLAYSPAVVPPPTPPAPLERESPLPRYKRDLVQKMKILRQDLHAMQPQAGHCRLEVSREEIFEESYRQTMKMRPKDLRKRLMIKFRGEEGLDYGGVAREWLYLLSHEMLNPYYGLFQYSRDNVYTLQINADSGVNPEHLSYFHFVGRIIGIAIFHGHYLDGGFTLPFYKQLLGKPITLDDMESVDPELHRSLVWILENDITGVIDNCFCVEHNAFGQMLTHELKESGKEIPVTESNKKEYVRLYVNWRFLHGIETQFLALQKGLHELIPPRLLRPFDEKELELIISGLGKIDIQGWKANTRLKHCSNETDIVKWFWRTIDEYDEEKRARLLQFVTGSSRVPLQGFKALQGSTGSAAPRLFTIHQIDANTQNLPKAHTCFNRIDIPPYESYEKFYEKLTCAVEETCGFTVE